MKIGFDNNKYLTMQSSHIKERINQFGDKLYLEFGGKLFDDYHASRVLPGFAPDSKLQMLLQLKDQYTIAIVTHNMQQASRIADYTAFFLVGEMVEYGPTKDVFGMPKDKRTEDYITGRFG